LSNSSKKGGYQKQREQLKGSNLRHSIKGNILYLFQGRKLCHASCIRRETQGQYGEGIRRRKETQSWENQSKGGHSVGKILG